MNKFKGIHWSKMPNAEEIRRRIAESRKGQTSWNKGKTAIDTPEIAHGDRHHAWKSEKKVGKIALHFWVYRQLGSPMVCEECKKTFKNNHQIHWANKSGEYHRDTNDWIRLCVSCHKKYDLKRLGKI